MSRANVVSARSDGAGKTPRRVSLSPRSPSKAELSSGSNVTSSATGPEGESGELIITRGLKEILAKDMELRKSEDRRGSLGKRGKSSSPSTARKGAAPNFITCYLCGQQFGSASISIHQPQCYLKTLIAWERTDPALRGPKPLDPETHEKRIAERMAHGGPISTTTTGKALPVSPTSTTNAVTTMNISSKTSQARHQDVYNELQFEAFKKSLAPCPNCGRTFLPDRLVVHLRSCKVVAEAANKPMRSVNKPVSASSVTGNKAAQANTTLLPKKDNSSTSTNELQRVNETAALTSPRKSSSGSQNEPSPRPRLDLTSISKQQHTAAAVTEEEDNEKATSITTAGRRASVEAEKKPSVPREKSKEQDSHVSPTRVRADEQTLSAATATAAVVESTMTPRRSPRPRQPSQVTSEHNEVAPTYQEEEEVNAILQTKTAAPEHEEDIRMQSALSSRSLSEAHDEARSTPPLLMATQPGNSSSRDDNDAGNGAEGETVGENVPVITRRIKLNNVSHFKQVPSRLRQQLRQQRATLVPCRHCGRHFMPNRLSTHEEVCVGRDHGPTGIHLSGSTHATTATTTSHRSNSDSKPGRSLTSLSMSDNNGSSLNVGSVASPTMALAPRAGNEGGGSSEKRRNSLTSGKDTGVADRAEKPVTTTTLKSNSRRSSVETRPQPRRSSGKVDAASAVPPATKHVEQVVTAAESVPQFCGQCGTKLLTASQRFCIACGARIISA